MSDIYQHYPIAQGVQMETSEEVRQDLVKVIGNALRVVSALAPSEQIESLDLRFLRPEVMQCCRMAALQTVKCSTHSWISEV